MNESSDRGQDPLVDGIFDRVRQIDPGATEESVRLYFREIGEVAAAIHSLDVSDTALPIAFTPSLRDEALP